VLLHWHRSIAKMCKKAKTGTPSSKSDLGTSNALIRSTITSSKTRGGLKRRLAESSGFIAQAAAGRDAGENRAEARGAALTSRRILQGLFPPGLSRSSLRPWCARCRSAFGAPLRG